MTLFEGDGYVDLNLPAPPANLSVGVCSGQVKTCVEAIGWVDPDYSQIADSCFYLCGVGNAEKGISSSLHTPTFNIDENVLGLSTGLMAYCALKRLGNK